jgi:hypothetical protein
LMDGAKWQEGLLHLAHNAPHSLRDQIDRQSSRRTAKLGGTIDLGR